MTNQPKPVLLPMQGRPVSFVSGGYGYEVGGNGGAVEIVLKKDKV